MTVLIIDGSEKQVEQVGLDFHTTQRLGYGLYVTFEIDRTMYAAKIKNMSYDVIDNKIIINARTDGGIY